MENDLGADSLDEVEIIMEYEKEFKITVPDKDLCTLTTINDAVLYIQEKLIDKTGK
jgi:acyl carrier protein